MTQKKLQKGSQYEKFDLDNDGEISDGEMAMAHKVAQLEHQRNMNENLDKMQDQQRMMAWVAMALLLALCAQKIFACGAQTKFVVSPAAPKKLFGVHALAS